MHPSSRRTFLRTRLSFAVIAPAGVPRLYAQESQAKGPYADAVLLKGPPPLPEPG
jgi:hypothetical protein